MKNIIFLSLLLFFFLAGANLLAADPATLPYYSFSVENPEGGFCEAQTFGKKTPLSEPWNLLFASSTFLLGVLGVFRSRRTTMAYQVLFGLVAAYGFSAALYHATLSNGWYRIMDVSLSIMQSFVIIMLFHALYLFHLKSKPSQERRAWFRHLLAGVTLVFTIYPGAVHVAGESSASPWVAWLVFDLLWGLIAVLLILIYLRRKVWPETPQNEMAFRLVWYSIGACILAYICWSIDKFACSPVAAYLLLHGFWHFFMGLCFYSLINFSRYFSAYEYGFTPALARFPEKGPLYLPFVEWRERQK